MKLSPIHVDTLTEIINIGIGQAGAILNKMLGSHVKLQVPTVHILDRDELPGYLPRFNGDKLASVQMPFSGSMSGVASLVFPPDSASKLVSLLSGEQAGLPDMDALKVETLKEVGNIVLNGVMGSISNMVETHIDYSIPQYNETSASGLILKKHDFSVAIIVAEALFSIDEHDISGDILLLFEMSSLEALLSIIDNME